MFFHLLMLQPGALAGVLGGLVMADQASDASAQQAVVTEKMPADTADRRPFQAARGIGRGAGQAGLRPRTVSGIDSPAPLVYTC